MNTSQSLLKRGFTLPEVVITGLLLVMLMIPITRIAYLTVRGTQYARDAGTALALGQAKLEEFADEPYDSLASGQDIVDGYQRVWTVEESGYTKIVRLNVNWTILGRAQSINLNTIYTSPFVAGFSFD